MTYRKRRSFALTGVDVYTIDLSSLRRDALNPTEPGLDVHGIWLFQINDPELML